MSFKVEFLVSMTCEGCVNQIAKVLGDINSIERYEISLKTKTVLIYGRVSPSAIARSLEATGRTVVLRGLGERDSAAVCILESYESNQTTMDVFGLVRLVEVSASLLVLDITLNGLAPGTYDVEIHCTGDLRQGVASTGPVWDNGALCSIDVDDNGRAQKLIEVDTFRLWEAIGRAIVVRSVENITAITGVIARSAGAWENEKTICTCSGQSVWDERQELLRKQFAGGLH